MAKKSLYSRRRQQPQRVAARQSRRVRAKMYDNVDPMSLNNPFEDPDSDRYAIATPDNFQEDPVRGSEWKNDADHYAPESNFMLPMNDVPVNAADFAKIATMKAAACLKIAQAIFPDAEDAFVNDQAAVLVAGMSDPSVISTVRNIKAYEEEAIEVDQKVSEIEALTSKQADEGGKEVEIEVNMDSPKAEDKPADESLEDELEIDMGEDAELDVDDEIAAAFAGMEKAESNSNPSTELGISFDTTGVDNDIDPTYASVEEEASLAELFGTGNVNANHLAKTASRKSATNSNLRSAMVSSVQNSPLSGLENLWNAEPVVESSFI